MWMNKLLVCLPNNYVIKDSVNCQNWEEKYTVAKSVANFKGGERQPYKYIMTN